MSTISSSSCGLGRNVLGAAGSTAAGAAAPEMASAGDEADAMIVNVSRNDGEYTHLNGEKRGNPRIGSFMAECSQTARAKMAT